VRSHNIHLVKRLGTVGAFSHAVTNTVFNAIVAEHMATCLQDCVFEVLPTDGAECKSLGKLAYRNRHRSLLTYSKHLLFTRLVAKTLLLPCVSVFLDLFVLYAELLDLELDRLDTLFDGSAVGILRLQ
jgi:hypothetical protein